MHGVALSLNPDSRRSFILDPRYTTSRRSAKVHGHNNLEIGAWFPRQLVALFRGAHGHQQTGIFGDRDTGAFSIVVAGQYDDLDRDSGDYLYYSGSNSHNNEDPARPAESSGGTLALHTSLRTGKAVRVLRAATGKGKWAPTYGLRYDGLYRVVTVSRPRNARGGVV